MGVNMAPSEQQFDTSKQLDAALAVAVAARLAAAIESRGEAWLVVSGGRTPLGFFAQLAAQPLRWEKVIVTLADERWVDNQHPDSNEKLVREQLLCGAAAAAQFLPLADLSTDIDSAVSELDYRLMRAPRFAALVLGMGEDGHTASLFPGATALQQGLDINSGRSCIIVEPLTAPHLRVSLTLPRLLDSDEIFVHIVGPSKQQVLAKARASGEVSELPIRAVLRQHAAPVTIYWSGQ